MRLLVSDPLLLTFELDPYLKVHLQGNNVRAVVNDFRIHGEHSVLRDGGGGGSVVLR